MVAAECRHSANTRVTIGLMRRRRLRSAIRRLNDYGVAADTAECSCAKRRTDCSRLLDPAAIGKTAVALEVAEELNLILKPTVCLSTRTSYEPLCLAQTSPRVHDVPAPRKMDPLTYWCDCEGRRPDNRSNATWSGGSSARLAEPGRSRDVCVARPLPGKISALLLRRARASKYPS